MKPLKPIVRVREVMKSEVDIVDGMLTVADALKNMKHLDTRTLVVDKRHPDDEYGVVMFRDIAKRVLAPNLSPERINVYEIMSKPVISVDPQMDVRYCIQLFDRFGISRAPVIENGMIVGLVSYTDIVLKSVMLDS
jgi:signal-transduction protein with cAMP-binding, CBS, and nucleotidyltransferase domain